MILLPDRRFRTALAQNNVECVPRVSQAQKKFPQTLSLGLTLLNNGTHLESSKIHSTKCDMSNFHTHTSYQVSEPGVALDVLNPHVSP
jgi:hypothetical protein